MSLCRATVSRDSVQFRAGFGTALLVDAVDESAEAAGVQVGQQLIELECGGMDYDVADLRLRALNAVLSRHKTFTITCSSSVEESGGATSLTAMDHHSAHEESQVFTLRGLLSPTDIERIHEAAVELQQQQAPHMYDNELINSSTEDMAFGLRPRHESVFLHEDGYFARVCPELCQRIVDSVRDKYTGDTHLGVRCIEYHTYRIGGALLDPEHRDMGSALTLSCLLSEPEDVDGGVFMTWAKGKPVCHDDLAMGDAVVFESERVHNVSAVMGGTRHSLVVEVWDGPDNRHDRHS